MRNQLVATRPKDSHDILGVFSQAYEGSSRNSVPPPGPEFVDDLQRRHAQMLMRRPEARPGELKLDFNYAGSTEFVAPANVRGTLIEGSMIGLSIPEGLSRAIFYLFLVAEVHPFDDGNGRIARLTMNAELSRVGRNRIIIPTLFHPQFVDCLRVLTRQGDVTPFVRALGKMAMWSAQFDYRDLGKIVPAIKATNAFEDSPTQFQLMNIDGTRAG